MRGLNVKLWGLLSLARILGLKQSICWLKSPMSSLLSPVVILKTWQTPLWKSPKSELHTTWMAVYMYRCGKKVFGEPQGFTCIKNANKLVYKAMKMAVAAQGLCCSHSPVSVTGTGIQFSSDSYLQLHEMLLCVLSCVHVLSLSAVTACLKLYLCHSASS